MAKDCPKCGASVDDDLTVCPHCRFILLDDDEFPDDFDDSDDVMPEGTIVAGDYRIVRMVGMGGAGTVYEARQLSLNNMPVALKVLHADLNEDEKIIRLLKKEVIINRELTHENIMKVYSLERMDDQHLIVMEYVEGRSLQEIVDSAGKLTLEKAASLLVNTCNALAYAHDRGVVHLDIKPANILVGTAGNVKLCDFGIARMAMGNTTMATQRIITGSVGYMPPEQYRGRQFVSVRSDIYSLGATVYTALTGEVPIGILDDEAVPQCVLRAMQRKPEDRFETVSQFQDCFIEETELDLETVRGTPTRITLLTQRNDADGKDKVPEAVADVSGLGKKEIKPAQETSRAQREPTVSRPAPAAEKVADEKAVQGRPGDGAPPIAEKPFFKKPVLIGAAAAAAILVVVIALMFMPGRDGSQETTAQVEKAGQDTVAEKAPQRKTFDGKLPAMEVVKTVEPDEAVVKEITQTIDRFIDSLNREQLREAYGFLSGETQDLVSMTKFGKDFFQSPRLWKADKTEFGKTPEGLVLGKYEIKMMDAYLGTIRSVTAQFLMIKGKAGWKIANYKLS
ncbi:protein kinase [Thermodesulfobacteriota bacterium]